MDPPNAKPYTHCTVKDGKKSYKGLAVGYGKIYTNPNTCYFSFFLKEKVRYDGARSKDCQGKWAPFPLEKG